MLLIGMSRVAGGVLHPAARSPRHSPLRLPAMGSVADARVPSSMHEPADGRGAHGARRPPSQPPIAESARQDQPPAPRSPSPSPPLTVAAAGSTPAAQGEARR